MKWTSDKPTQPGWYWWRQQSNALKVIIEIVEDRERKVKMYGGRLFRSQGGYWAGPIPEPEEGA